MLQWPMLVHRLPNPFTSTPKHPAGSSGGPGLPPKGSWSWYSHTGPCTWGPNGTSVGFPKLAVPSVNPQPHTRRAHICSGTGGLIIKPLKQGSISGIHLVCLNEWWSHHERKFLLLSGGSSGCVFLSVATALPVCAQLIVSKNLAWILSRKGFSCGVVFHNLFSTFKVTC